MPIILMHIIVLSDAFFVNEVFVCIITNKSMNLHLEYMS
jgi:hypothetical protein